MTLKVGVIGTGMIGQFHIQRLTKKLAGVSITAVSDIDLERAKSAAPEGAEVFDKYENLITSDNVDAVVICSWGPAHRDQLIACITAGKPVFCEKPLADTEEACKDIMDAEVAHGSRLVQVGFMRRFDADYRRLKATIDSGDLGAALMYRSVHRNAEVPAELYTSDMALNDTMVHDTDVSRWLLSDEVVAAEVRKPKRSSRGGELSDPTLALLHTAKGIIIQVEISVNIAYGYDIRGEVSGEIGVASLPERPGTVIRDQHGVRQAVPVDWRDRFEDAFQQELLEWVQAATQGTATGPSVWDGYAATVVSDAAIKSVETGQREAVSMCEKPSIY